MQRKLFAISLAACVFSALALFGSQAYGQERREFEHEANSHPNGSVQDWSHHHVRFSRVGPISTLIALQHDPRALASWQAQARLDWRRSRGFGHPRVRTSSTHRDWAISLGGGSMAPAMFPAKFNFDPNAAVTAANCLSDFIVFTVNVTGGATQPNIVAFRDLYSGAGPGLCSVVGNRPSYFTGDTLTSAVTYWSYNITAAGGQVPTSPALSLDGTKVAFVESSSGSTAHFHVLAFNPGTGVIAGDGVNTANSQDATSKTKTINSGFDVTAPVAGSGNVTDLALATGTSQSDTLSSPFIDYNNDTAYVGNDSGIIFRIKNVFCTVKCTPGTSPAPALDSSWGGTGAVTIGGTCTGKVTAPVIDNGSQHIFVGCSDGKVYGFTILGVALSPNPSLTVGDGTATGGVVDSPMIDAVNGFIYAASGSSSSGKQVIVQAKTSDLSSVVAATLGAGGIRNLHDPDFNDNYFSQGTNTAPLPWLLYVPGVDPAGTNNALWGITFGAGHAMTAGTPGNQHAIPLTQNEFSPATEFLSGGEDRLFECAQQNTGGNLAEFNITGVFPPAGPPESFMTEASGTTGIVVDNSSNAAQADSIYFAGVGPGTNANSAVKLTQSALQ